ncbi:MAG TPA: hypothetical protein VE687_08255, partial [Stellaceae bacterium]|nr:hypothetical protein [Stellaceae bacterium]
YPCYGNSLANMQNTAIAVFSPTTAGSAAFAINNNCSSGTGLTGTYYVTVLSVVDLQLQANSCYPLPPPPPPP